MNKILNDIARETIGDGKTPNMFFVSYKGEVITITQSFDTAYQEWRSLPKHQESALEDRLFGTIASTEPTGDNSSKLVTYDDADTFLSWLPSQTTLEKLAKCGGSIKIRLSNKKYAPWAVGEGHNPHYRITLKGPGGSYTFDFWGSINDGATGKEATAYAVLACLTWHDPGSDNEFYYSFGYMDGRDGYAAWKACCRQYAALCRVFPDETDRAFLATIK